MPAELLKPAQRHGVASPAQAVERVQSTNNGVSESNGRRKPSDCAKPTASIAPATPKLLQSEGGRGVLEPATAGDISLARGEVG